MDRNDNSCLHFSVSLGQPHLIPTQIAKATPTFNNRCVCLDLSNQLKDDSTWRYIYNIQSIVQLSIDVNKSPSPSSLIIHQTQSSVQVENWRCCLKLHFQKQMGQISSTYIQPQSCKHLNVVFVLSDGY